MSRMFAMDQAKRVEELSSIGMIIAVACKVDQDAMSNVRIVLDHISKNSGYGQWSNERKNEVTKKARTDEEILAMVESLGKI